jgi:long-chain acyl-CoA synthetase
MFVSIVDKLNLAGAEYSSDTALVYKKSSLTYKNLLVQYRQIASFLNSNGLKRGDRVAILLENSPEYVVAYYAVLQAGGTVVSLNHAAKSTDLVNWIKHSGSNWLVTSSNHPELKDIAAILGDQVSYLITSTASSDIPGGYNYDDVIAGNYGLAEFPAINSDSIAAIIYTSGTTGQPKGVTLTHGNLTANIDSILHYLPITNIDKCLNVLPFYYSFGNSVLHTHLLSGATLYLENSFLFPHQIIKMFQDEKITAFYGVPSTYALLLNRTKMEDYDLSSIKYLAQAGGAMLPEHIKRIKSYFHNAQFFVMYGQTEATARLAWLPPDKLNEKAGSVGIAIPNVKIEIRNKQGDRVAVGELGEIYASGPNIMQGYWKDNELTASVLIDGWLKTGDLATRDADGFIYIAGRESEMIKSGAHRISPLDIEEVVLRITGVEDVAVIGLPDEILGQVIMACIVTNKTVNIDKRDIQAHCKQHLATYKIPKFIHFMNELPKTASGKIKRFELQKLVQINH